MTRRIEELRGVPVLFVVIDELSPPITKERWDALDQAPPSPDLDSLRPQLGPDRH